jgi:hypothetical protein
MISKYFQLTLNKYGRFKKVFSLAIAVFILLSTVVVPVSAATFKDTQGHWAQDSMNKWNEYGVVKGYDGEFRPNDSITRAEFATMIDNIMKYVEKGENSFSDLNANQWYYNVFNKLNKAGVMNDVDGKALPNQNITRQEAAVMISKAFNIANSSDSTSFKDEGKVAEWAKGSVNALVSKKIINGLPDGTFMPLAPLTRAAAVTIFNNFIQDLISKPGEYSKNVSGNLVVNSAGVILKDMKITGDLYISQGVGEGEVTLNNVEITGSVFVRGGGEHSVIFNSVDVKGSLVVNKYNGKVRILATGSTSVSVTKLESGALLVTKELVGGGFEVVEISAEILAGQDIVLDGNFNKVINQSTTANITANGKINELVAGVNTTISGNAVVNKVTTENGATATVNNNTAPPAAGGNGGNVGGGTIVAVTGVSIDQNNLSLVVKETKQLTAAVAPSNASNKKLNWKVEDDSTNVITINQAGLVTAIGEGIKTVQVTTEDGGKSARLTVKVSKPSMNFSLSKFEGARIEPGASIDDAIITNSSNLSIKAVVESVYKANYSEATIVAEKAMQQSVDPAGKYAYAVITLKDGEGHPIADTSGITARITGGGTNYEPEFGAGLAEGSKAGSFVLKINAGNPESIQRYNLTLSQNNYADTTIAIDYLPEGTAYLTSIEPVTGEKTIGSQISAANVHYEGTAANHNLTYQWLRSDKADGFYTVIEGATASKYELTNEDSGKYIRVLVYADYNQVGGSALSEPFGPIEKAVTNSEVFKAIEAAFLGSNENLNNIISNLNLMTSLSAFPGVTLTWETNNVAVISRDGVVTRDAKNDQFVELTVSLSGKATDTKVYPMIVRAKGTDNVDIVDFIDPYFVDGYPQAYVKDGTIWVRYKLNAPADVFMVVNAINGSWESSVKAVLEGHAGEDDYMIWVDEWPYFKVDSSKVNQVQEFNTGVTLKESSARLEFVIQDTGKSYTSSAVTTIQFDKETVDALDTYPPYSYSMYLNKDLNAIYIYYSEWIDLNSIPKTTDYTLNKGIVNNVTLYNYPDQWGAVSSYVKLEVSGITDANKESIQLSYTGNAIQDTTDAKNKEVAYTGRFVNRYDELIKAATITSDRKSMIVEIVPGWNPKDNHEMMDNASLFSVNIENQGSYKPASANYSYSTNFISYRLTFDAPLPAGAATVKVNTTGIKNWTMDAYPNELVSEEVTELPAPGTPSAVYSKGEIQLTFADGFAFKDNTFNGAGLTLKVDNVQYALRGYIVRAGWTNKNVLVINLNDQYSSIFKDAVEAGSVIEIRYTKINGESADQFSDMGGALVPDFGNITVAK